MDKDKILGRITRELLPHAQRLAEGCGLRLAEGERVVLATFVSQRGIASRKDLSMLCEVMRGSRCKVLFSRLCESKGILTLETIRKFWPAFGYPCRDELNAQLRRRELPFRVKNLDRGEWGSRGRIAVVVVRE